MRDCVILINERLVCNWHPTMGQDFRTEGDCVIYRRYTNAGNSAGRSWMVYWEDILSCFHQAIFGGKKKTPIRVLKTEKEWEGNRIKSSRAGYRNEPENLIKSSQKVAPSSLIRTRRTKAALFTGNELIVSQVDNFFLSTNRTRTFCDQSLFEARNTLYRCQDARVSFSLALSLFTVTPSPLSPWIKVYYE